jgi:aspartyl-tRNA(Asn)/glutamyl-tRNA(Gln) amidotransferase subunit C
MRKSFGKEERLMALTPDEVRHVARLARLALTAEEIDRMTQDLEQVLDHVAVLRQAPVEGVAPTYHVYPPADPWRADVVKPGLSREAALQNAPEAREGQIRVPRIVEEAP